MFTAKLQVLRCKSNRERMLESWDNSDITSPQKHGIRTCTPNRNKSLDQGILVGYRSGWSIVAENFLLKGVYFSCDFILIDIECWNDGI